MATPDVPERWIELGASALTGGVNYVQPGDFPGPPGTKNRLTAIAVLHPVLADLRRQVKALPRASMADGRYLLWEEQVLDLLNTGGSDE